MRHCSITFMTPFLLLLSWFFLALFGQQHGSDTELVRVGIILEDKSINEELIVDELEKLRKSLPQNIKIEPRLIQLSDVDSYEVVRSACVMLGSHFGLFLSITTCASNAVLSGMARDKRVPHLAVNYHCDTYDTNLEKSDFSFPLVVDSFRTVDVAVAQIMKIEKWTSFVIIHDESISNNRVSAFIGSVEKQTKDLKHTVIEIHQSKLANKSAEGWSELFNERIRYIFEEDAKDYFNFIILAELETTEHVIKNAEQVIEDRQVNSYNWILANQELTISQLRQLNTKSKIIALSRKETESPRTTKRDRSSANSDSVGASAAGEAGRENRDVEYLLDGLWVVRDLILTTAGQIEWTQVGQLECSSENTGTFKDGDKLASALKSVDIKARSGSVKFIGDRLKVFIELDIWATKPAGGKQRVKSSDTSKKSQQKSEGDASGNDGNDVDDSWELIGHWDVENKLQLVKGRTKPFQENFLSIEDLKLRIVTVVERPFIIRNEGKNGTKEFTGCCVDILNAIQKELRNKNNGLTFDYEMYEVADKKYGIVDPKTKKWNGLIGDILQKKADMAVAGMIRNYERQLVVDFTASYMDYGVSILISKPQKTNNVFGFLKPLTVQVWISICVATFLIGLLLFVLSQLSPFSRFNLSGSDEFNFKNAMWFALASLMQQGGDATPVTTSGRILGTFWWFFSLIIVATYTANLAAFLTVTRMETPIESLEDLANQHKIRYGTVADSSLQYFFRDQAGMDQLYERIWTYMSETEPAPMVRNEEEGLHLVLNGDYAFLWDDPVLQFHRKQNCHKLQVVGKPFNKKNYAFAVPKGAPYYETITLSILRLQESGELDKIKQKWFESSTTCTEEDKGSATKSAEGIELDNVAGVFYILGAGAVVSLLTCVIEYIWYKYLNETHTETSHASSARKLNTSCSDFRNSGKSSAKDKKCDDCLGGEVILNKSASFRNSRLFLNGGPPKISSTLTPTLPHVITNNNNISNTHRNGSNMQSPVDLLTPDSSFNSNRKNSFSPTDNNPPYLDYLPLKKVNNPTRMGGHKHHRGQPYNVSGVNV